jgi:hypothetical protein
VYNTYEGENMKTKIKKPRGKPFRKGDLRINRKGAPKREQSWAGILREIGDMTGPQVSAWGVGMLKEFSTLPPGLTLKYLVGLHAYASLLRDFSPGVWSTLMERTDGRVVTPIETRVMGEEPLQIIMDR